MTDDTIPRPPLDRPPLDVRRLSRSGELGPGLRVEVVEEATSTNELVAQRAREGAADGLVVVAEHQSAGRGRLDRSWQAPARSSLTFSVLLRPSAPTRSWPWLPLLTGYAVHKALRVAGHDTALKWPNDVLVGDRKVAGILLERVETAAGAAAVLGVGLNVSLTTEELPVPTATSLALASGREIDRTELLVGVLATLREAYDAWEAGGDLGGVRLSESYQQACSTLGQEVRVELPAGGPLVGTATGIDPGGRLLVRHDGTTTAVGVGDVVHVRRPEPA